jgi:hypothetical protein
MSLAKHVLLMVAVLVGLSGLFARAADEPAKTSAAGKTEAKGPSADEIAKLVEQLDAERFSERQAASEKLAEIGKPAIAPLAKAAVGDSLEVTTRAIALLGKFLDSSDQATKDAAKTALEGLAKSDKSAVARRAQEYVKQPAKEQPAGQGGIVVGQFQIQAGGIIGGNKRRTMKNVNGVKEIEAEEDGKKVKIIDDPQKGIKVEHTYKKDGKEVTDKYEAKDAKELEKKSPEGYKLYKQYSEEQAGGIGGNIQIQVQQGGIQLIPGQPAPVPNIQPAARGNRVEIAKRLMQNLGKQIELLTKDLKEAPKESKESLKKQIDELKKQLDDLNKKLDEK